MPVVDALKDYQATVKSLTVGNTQVPWPPADWDMPGKDWMATLYPKEADDKEKRRLMEELTTINDALTSGLMPLPVHGHVAGHVVLREVQKNQVVVRVLCDKESHRIIVRRDGTITCEHHPCVEADLSLLVMAKEQAAGCMAAYQTWLRKDGPVMLAWKIFFGNA